MRCRCPCRCPMSCGLAAGGDGGDQGQGGIGAAPRDGHSGPPSGGGALGGHSPTASRPKASHGPAPPQPIRRPRAAGKVGGRPQGMATDGPRRANRPALQPSHRPGPQPSPGPQPIGDHGRSWPTKTGCERSPGHKRDTRHGPFPQHLNITELFQPRRLKTLSLQGEEHRLQGDRQGARGSLRPRRLAVANNPCHVDEGVQVTRAQTGVHRILSMLATARPDNKANGKSTGM
jgi:hypothetical protein